MSQDVNKPAYKELASQYDEEVNLSSLCKFDENLTDKLNQFSGGQAINMKNKGSIFQKTYDDYLERIRDLSLNNISHKLGAKYEENQCKIKLFNNEYTVSAAGITDVSDQQPSYDICVIDRKSVV